MTGLARDVVRGFGLEPAAIAAGDVAGAMTRGEVLAAELGGALTSHALGVTTAAPYRVGTSINRHGSALSLGMRRAFWDSLSADRSGDLRRGGRGRAAARARRGRGPPPPALRPTRIEHGRWHPSFTARSAASPTRWWPTSPPPTRTRSASMRPTSASAAWYWATTQRPKPCDRHPSVIPHCCVIATGQK